MNIDGRKSILSYFLIIAAGSKVVAAAVNAVVRVIRIQIDNYDTAMLNKSVETIGNILIIVQLVAIVIGYFYLRKKLSEMRSQASDTELVSILRQEEQLLKIWSFVLILIQVVHEIVSLVYKSTMSKLLSIMMDAGFKMDVYAAIYIETHGLKYVCMITALAVAIYVTGIMRKDLLLKGGSIGLLGIFVLIVAFFPSKELVILGHELRIAWSSVLYHLLETVGLIGIAICVSCQRR